MRSLKTSLWIDAFIFAGAMAALQPRLTGSPIHEWLALATAATLVLHVALHGDWVIGVTRSFFRNLMHVSRLDYLVDALLFVAFTTTVASGLVISRVVMPALGVQMLSGGTWREIHSTSANLTLFLVATHFALHWSWVKNSFRRIVITPLQSRLSAIRTGHESRTVPGKTAKAL